MPSLYLKVKNESVFLRKEIVDASLFEIAKLKKRAKIARWGGCISELEPD